MGKCARITIGMSVVLTTSCVVPIPVDFDGQDAEAPRNDSPDIVKAVPTDFPGPIIVRSGTPQEYTVTLRDNDLNDTLYVRVYRDYQIGALGPLDDRSVSNDPRTGKAERTVLLKDNNWCNAVVPGATVYIEVVVADQPFDPDVTKKPEYQATSGNTARAWWFATCAQPV